MTTIEIDKSMLKVMLNEYWAVDNNPTCTTATVWFLREIGFDDNDVSDVINEEHEERDIEEIKDNIKSEMRYMED